MAIEFLFPTHGSIDSLKEFMFTFDRKQFTSNFMKEIIPVHTDTLNFTEKIEELVQELVQEPVKESNAILQEPIQCQSDLEKRTFQAKHVQDSLFGSIYLSYHGLPEFKRVAKHFGKVDGEEKQKIISYLQSVEFSVLKSLTNYPLTKVLYNKILNDLATCPKIPLHCLIGISLYYKSNIYLINSVKNIYLSFLYKNEDSKTMIIYKNPNPSKKMSVPDYYVDLCENVMKLEQIKDVMFGLVHYEKPLKGISSYKVIELESIASSLGIHYEDKIKKNELYAKVGVHCIWD